MRREAEGTLRLTSVQGHASRMPFSMRRIVMGLVILTALLAGVALLSAYALPLLTSAQHGQRMLQTEHDAPPGAVPPLQDDSHALVRFIFSMQSFVILWPELHVTLSRQNAQM